MARRRNSLRQVNSLLGLFNIHHTGRLFWALYRDRRVSLLMKVYATSGLVYFFSPMDNVPHKFTGVDLVDDIIVGLVIMQTFIEMAPAEVVDEHCERLNIDIDRVFLNVPQTVTTAIDLFMRYGGAGGRQGPPGRGWWAPPPNAYTYPPPGFVSQPDSPEPPPGYMRYSAYREEDGESR